MTSPAISTSSSQQQQLSHQKLRDSIITPTTAVIRTSDRLGFKRCRRAWNWQSHLARNLEPRTQQSPLWFGTGIHFAMEDMYGSKRFETPKKAFQAYVKATQKNTRQNLPDDWQELAEMGEHMIEYYSKYWLIERDPFQTYIHNGEPQVEVNFLVEIPFDIKAHFPDSPYTKAVYSGTIDRVVIDEQGLLWLVDYKTAKIMKLTHFANDPQVSAYSWAAYHIYQRPIAGMIYWQFLKTSPIQPAPLKSGKISTAKNKRTSHRLYRQALIDQHGSVMNSPKENVDYLNDLINFEGPDHDAYIRRDKIYKNSASLESEGTKILMEMEDMLNPNLPLYPNPNFMCPSLCSFYEVCVSIDDGSDWEEQLIEETQQRATSDESWRKFLVYPEDEQPKYKKDFE